MLTIRPATEADVPKLQQLMQETGLELDGVDYSKWSHPTLVATRDNVVVGMIQANLGQPYATMTEFAISPTIQLNRGRIGLKLIEGMELIMRMAGVTAYRTYERKDDPHMCELVEKWGCERTGEGFGYIRRLQ